MTFTLVTVQVYRLLIQAQPLFLHLLHYLTFFVYLLFTKILFLYLSFAVPIKPPLNFFLLIFLLRMCLRGCLCSAERDGMIFLNGQHPSLAIPRLSTHVAPSLSPVTWHGRLGHPSSAILQSLVSSGLISLSTPLSSSFYCESYLCNKSQRLPFGLRV